MRTLTQPRPRGGRLCQRSQSFSLADPPNDPTASAPRQNCSDHVMSKHAAGPARRQLQQEVVNMGLTKAIEFVVVWIV